MCGIVGYSGRFEPALLEEMITALAHRGPDDRGRWADPAAGVGLGQARLSIIDLSADGHQPMTNEDGSLWLTYNGELYNYRDLAAGLVARGHRFRSRTDSEVFLHLYEEKGPAMLADLNGIFAFALWDSRRREMLVARDALGVKPLYYAPLPAGLAFASELKALLPCPGLAREIDLEALQQYLAFLWAPAPRTLLQGVRKLPPGSALLVRDGRIAREWTWYTLPYDGIRRAEPEADLARELAVRLETAVDRQLMADVPVGAFLSGGLDSSAVVAMAARRRPGERFPCYSIGFPPGEASEDGPSDLPFARRVADHLGVDLREIVVRPSQLAGRLEELIWCLDEPQADPAPLNALFIAEAARRDGIKVLLSGAGGDDLFTGYRRHLALTMEPLWDWWPAPVRRLAGRLAGRVGNAQHPLFRRLRRGFGHMHLDGDERLVSYFLWSADDTRRPLLHPDVRRDLAGRRAEDALLASLADIPAETDPLQRMLFLEGRHFLGDHNLPYTDKTSMAYGVEARVPLLDLELVRFAAGIPPGLKQQGKVGKAIFKKAMEPFLPREVIYREKTGFGAPLRLWLRGDLRPVVDELLSPDRLRARGLFDPEGVRRLLAADARGRVDGGYTIFALLCVEVWCCLFLDRRPWRRPVP